MVGREQYVKQVTDLRDVMINKIEISKVKEKVLILIDLFIPLLQLAMKYCIIFS